VAALLLPLALLLTPASGDAVLAAAGVVPVVAGLVVQTRAALLAWRAGGGVVRAVAAVTAVYWFALSILLGVPSVAYVVLSSTDEWERSLGLSSLIAILGSAWLTAFVCGAIVAGVTSAVRVLHVRASARA
jgi:hypothetical protein